MTLGRNLIVGLANSIWTALIGLAVVPFYLKYLGVEAYGLIGFFVTTQAVLSLLDMGMTPTISREVARCSASGNLIEAGKLLHSLAVVYWSAALAIALIFSALAPLIEKYWLQSKHLSAESVLHALILMGLVVACRWPIGLYQGALIGAQRLAVSSGINMVMATITSLGAVTILSFVSPTIEAFFIWQAGVGLLYALVMRVAAWRIIGKVGRLHFSFDSLKVVWRFTAGMSGVAISSIILMQLDKILLSKLLGLSDFGKYALAGVVASGLYILLTPTFNVIYPRFSELVAKNESEKLYFLYRSGTRLLLAVLFPIAGVAALLSEEMLFLWTRDPVVASSTAPVVSLFLIGTALNGVMHFPYALQLAHGKPGLAVKINLVLVGIMIPTTIFLASHYGAVGGAGAWAILNAIYVFLGTFLTHQYFLKGVGGKWLLQDVIVPLGITLLVVGLLGREIVKTEFSYHLKMIIGGGLFVFTSLSIIGLSPVLRNSIVVVLAKSRSRVCVFK